MMALIGDTYKAENQEVEATKIYALTRELYPKSEGALVSLMRLADFGALREIFGENDVFQEMEDGSRETTIKIYKLVLESAQDSGIVSSPCPGWVRPITKPRTTTWPSRPSRRS